VRNLFDQYTQPENRLTHALLSSLARDLRLLRRFLHWTVRDGVPGRLEVLEQRLPGDTAEAREDEGDRRGIPDGCISDGSEWAVLIESKIAAQVSADQIRRHLRSAAKRGLSSCTLLLLTVGESTQQLPNKVLKLKWSAVYRWLCRERPRSQWAGIAAEYLEVAEARGVEQGYLKEGTLTVFSGIPFGPAEPYSYIQAKRLLGLLLSELRQDRRLQRELGSDPDSKGRGAITGRGGAAVWDFIGLKASAKSKTFTEYPHLTVGIRDSRLEIYVTVPNNVKAKLRSKLLGASFEEFSALIGDITGLLCRALRRCSAASPMVVLVQRRYPSQRSPAILDAQLRFDPRTSFRSKGHRTVKCQPEWLRSVYDILKNRQSNLQFQIGADLPYGSCPVIESPHVKDLAVDIWLACKPLINAAIR
jgi:hypothetical protein